jgi:hypothetical protein
MMQDVHVKLNADCNEKAFLDKKKTISTNKLDLNLRKKPVN